MANSPTPAKRARKSNSLNGKTAAPASTATGKRRLTRPELRARKEAEQIAAKGIPAAKKHGGPAMNAAKAAPAKAIGAGSKTPQAGKTRKGASA